MRAAERAAAGATAGRRPGPCRGARGTGRGARGGARRRSPAPPAPPSPAPRPAPGHHGVDHGDRALPQLPLAVPLRPRGPDPAAPGSLARGRHRGPCGARGVLSSRRRPSIEPTRPGRTVRGRAHQGARRRLAAGPACPGARRRAVPRARGAHPDAAASRPVAVERPFTLQIGPHRVHGRIDRVDRLPQGGFGLVDYKTGAPPTGGARRGGAHGHAPVPRRRARGLAGGTARRDPRVHPRG